MEKVGNEMRGEKRLLKRFEVEFATSGQNYRGLCRNLGPNGLFIKTRKIIPSDTLIEMTVHLPDGSISKLSGRIKWAIRDPYGLIFERAGISSKDGIGVQLIDKDNNYFDYIKSLTKGI
jgi:hypothetical protein